MSSNRKTYSKDFKDMIVEIYKSGKSSSEICKEYGIGISSLSRRIKEREEISTDNGDILTKKQIKEIQKENTKLRQ